MSAVSGKHLGGHIYLCTDTLDSPYGQRCLFAGCSSPGHLLQMKSKWLFAHMPAHWGSHCLRSRCSVHPHAHFHGLSPSWLAQDLEVGPKICALFRPAKQKPGDTPLRASGSLALTSSRPNAPPSRSESRGRAQAKSRCRPFPHPTAQPTAGPARINPRIFPVLPLLHRGSALLSGFPSNSLRNPFTYQRLPCTLLISSPLRPSLLPTPED